MQITNTSGASSPTDLLPPGFLCWAMVTFRGMKASNSGGRYADIELAVADKQPFARRKLWEMVGDPDFQGNSEGYRNMGMASLTRMVESAGIVNPADPATYEKLNGKTCEQVMMLLDGKYVAIRVKVEKGGDGYEDKNKVGDYLTPNSNSSSHKNFQKLLQGDHGLSGNPAAARGASASGGGFGHAGNQQQGQSNTPVRQGGFGGQQEGSAAAERPLDAQPMNRPSEAPAAAQTGNGGGFNPNAAPEFLTSHQQ